MSRIFSYANKVLIAMVIGIIIVLSACVTDPNSYYFNSEELLQNISMVELIDYNSTYEYVDNRYEIEPFNFDKAKVGKSLPENRIAPFCKSLSEIGFIICDDMLGYNSSACGISLLLRFCNGDLIVMSDNHKYNSFVAEYDSDGKLGELVLCFMDSSSCQELIDTYFYSTN